MWTPQNKTMCPYRRYCLVEQLIVVATSKYCENIIMIGLSVDHQNWAKAFNAQLHNISLIRLMRLSSE